MAASDNDNEVAIRGYEESDTSKIIDSIIRQHVTQNLSEGELEDTDSEGAESGEQSGSDWSREEGEED